MPFQIQVIVGALVLFGGTSCAHRHGIVYTPPFAVENRSRHQAPEATCCLWLSAEERTRTLPDAKTVTLRVESRPENGALRAGDTLAIGIGQERGSETWRCRTLAQDELIDGALAVPAGTLRLSGDQAMVQPSEALSRAFEQFAKPPTSEQVVLAVFRGTNPETLASLAGIAHPPGLEDALALALRNWDGATVESFRQAGAHYSYKEYVNLARHRVNPGFARAWLAVKPELKAEQLVYVKLRRLEPGVAIAWRKAGYDLDPEQLYYANVRHLSSGDAEAWRKANYNLNLENLFYAKVRHLDPAQAMKWKTAGHDLDLEGLYYAQVRHLDAGEAEMWRQAGYDLKLPDLYHAKTRRLSPSTAQAWKKAGYSWSIEELHRLQLQHVDFEWAQALGAAGKKLTLAEILSLRRSHVPPETLRKLAGPN